eukprot:428582-Alexandrium_andersonii.AAC.1
MPLDKQPPENTRPTDRYPCPSHSRHGTQKQRTCAVRRSAVPPPVGGCSTAALATNWERWAGLWQGLQK